MRITVSLCAKMEQTNYGRGVPINNTGWEPGWELKHYKNLLACATGIRSGTAYLAGVYLKFESASLFTAGSK